MEYCIAEKVDRKEIIEFLNEIFSCSENRNLDFRIFMRKIYADKDGLSQTHHLVKEDGRIAAFIGIYQRKYRIGSTELNTGFIGSVSVAADKRGKGYMKLLMKKAEEDMRSKGISMAMLSGNRNRYGYFGYETGGMRYRFCFERRNITHTVGWEAEKHLELIHVHERDMAVDEIYSLYENTKLHSCSREEFFDRALTWNGRLYSIKADNRYLGYVILSEDGESISEIELSDWGYFLHVIREFMLLGDKERISVYSLMWENEKNKIMQQYCETYHIQPACMYKVLDYLPVLKALFELQLLYKPYLSDDIFTIGIKEQGCYKIQIANKKATVEEEVLEGVSYKNADIVVEDREFVNAFMSPAFNLYEDRAKRPYPAGWFPLGFAPAIADEF